MPCEERTDWIDLKHCPCCGSAAEFRAVPAEAEEDVENAGAEWIECIVCGLTTPMMFPIMQDVKPLLAEKWNRRVPA